MGDYVVTLTEEQEKALLTDMISIQAWLDNAIQNKARQCVDTVCTEALSDDSDTILTKVDKQEIVQELAKQGRVISTVKQLPQSIKEQIVTKANVQSAAERQSELTKKM